MRVMLDLDSEALRKMLLEKMDPATEPWTDLGPHGVTEFFLDTLRSLAADGLLVRG